MKKLKNTEKNLLLTIIITLEILLLHSFGALIILTILEIVIGQESQILPAFIISRYDSVIIFLLLSILCRFSSLRS